MKKKAAEMTPDEMRRKGSWAVRFYGRKGKLPPLRDEHGEPTRFAKTAAAWGEPVPRTEAAARRIGAKGRRLLDRYRKTTERKQRERGSHPGARRQSGQHLSRSTKSGSMRGRKRQRARRRTPRS